MSSAVRALSIKSVIARMVATPSPVAVARPVAVSITAADAWEERQITESGIPSTTSPRLSRAMTPNRMVSPTDVSFAAAGITSRKATLLISSSRQGLVGGHGSRHDAKTAPVTRDAVTSAAFIEIARNEFTARSF